MSRRFAEGTTVAAGRTRHEIEALLERYGATQFVSGWTELNAVLGFVMRDRQIRFVLPMPAATDEEFTHRRVNQTGTLQPRTDLQAKEAFSQEVSRRWRSLALIVKAKLEAVESGIVTFEDEFLAHTVLPDGQTAGEWLKPQVAEAYRIGAMPSTLLGLPAPSSEDES
jgi:hypothetical protein